MSAQRDQGAEMAPRLSLRRRAVPDRAAQPTHSGERERSLRAETQQPVRQRQMRLTIVLPSRARVHVLIIRRSDERDTETRSDRCGRRCETCDPFRILPVSPVADYRIRSGCRKIQHRRTIDGDPDPRQVVGDQPSAEAGRLRRRRVRPSSWSIRTGASSRLTQSRSAATRSRN